MGSWGQHTVQAGTFWDVLNVSLCASGAQLRLDIQSYTILLIFGFFSSKLVVLINIVTFLNGFFYIFLSVLSDHLTTLRQVLARNVIMDQIFGRSCIKNSKQPRTTDQNHENTM